MWPLEDVDGGESRNGYGHVQVPVPVPVGQLGLDAAWSSKGLLRAYGGDSANFNKFFAIISSHSSQ